MFQSGCSKKWLLDIRSKSEDSNDNEEEEEDTKFRAFSLQHGRKVVLVTWPWPPAARHFNFLYQVYSTYLFTEVKYSVPGVAREPGQVL